MLKTCVLVNHDGEPACTKAGHLPNLLWHNFCHAHILLQILWSFLRYSEMTIRLSDWLLLIFYVCCKGSFVESLQLIFSLKTPSTWTKCKNKQTCTVCIHLPNKRAVIVKCHQKLYVTNIYGKGWTCQALISVFISLQVNTRKMNFWKQQGEYFSKSALLSVLPYVQHIHRNENSFLQAYSATT